MSSIAISMSILNAEEKFSEKFVKDLEKFVIWMGENEYKLCDVVTGDPIEWNESLIDFEEPGRNKLESYVKELMKSYSLSKNEEEIDDIKTMIKEFRENKPKKINKKENEKVEKQKRVKKSDKTSNLNKIRDIIVNPEIETDVYYINTLDCSTQDLIKIFGEPLNNGTEKTKHQYEWKLEVISENENRIYSIYNWKDKNGNFSEFDDNEWHLGTVKSCPKNPETGCECQLQSVIQLIKNKLNSTTNENKSITIKTEQKNETEGGNKTKQTINELFNLSDEESEESMIDISGISF